MMFPDVCEHGFNGGRISRMAWGDDYIKRQPPADPEAHPEPVFHLFSGNATPRIWEPTEEDLSADDWFVKDTIHLINQGE